MPNNFTGTFYFIIVLSGIFIPQHLLAQNEALHIACSVLDSSTQQPIEGASIFVLEKTDNKVIAHAFANQSGDVSLDANTVSGAFILVSVQMLGYEKKVITLNTSQATQQLGKIYLKPLYKDLKGVTVARQKNIVKFDGNTIGYDLEGIPGMKYMTTTQIMENLPFIQVSEDKLEMMGAPITILIDGNPHPYYNNLKNLNSLPPQAIERIDVKLVGTGRFSGKVMDIRLKKNYFLGWSGSFNTGMGIYGVSGGGRAGYWSNKFGIDASFNYGYRNTPGRGMAEIRSGENKTIQQNKTRKSSSSGQISTSMFYKLDDRNTVDASWTHTPPFQSKMNSFSDLVFTDSEQQPFYQNNTLQRRSKTVFNGLSLNYTRDFKKKDRHLYILTNYQLGDVQTSIDLNQHQENNILLFSEFNNTKNDNREGTVEILYKDKLTDKLPYSVGTKVIKRNYLTDIYVNTRDSTKSPLTNTIQQVPSKYNQLVSSSYADVETKLKKFTLHGGFRFEYVSEEYIKPLSFHNNYVNFIPNASVTYNVNDKNLFVLSYTRNVLRPSFGLMTTVITTTNAYVKDSGNAYLKPQHRNSFGLQYYGNLKFGSLGLTVNYMNIRNLINYGYYLQGNDGTIINSSANVAHNNSFGLGISLNMPISKRIRFSHFTDVSTATLSDNTRKKTALTGYINDRLSYSIGKKQALSLSAVGYTANVSIQGKAWNYIRTGIHYSLYMDLFKARYPAQLGISFYDPFYFNGLPGYTEQSGPGFYYYTEHFTPNQFIGIAFNISLSGKANKGRTFNQSQSIQNNDITSPK